MAIKRDKNGKFASTGGPKGSGGGVKRATKVSNRASGSVKAASAAHKEIHGPTVKPARASGRAGVLGKAGAKTAAKIPNGPGTVGYGSRGKTGLAKAKMNAESMAPMRGWMGDTPAQKRKAKRK